MTIKATYHGTPGTITALDPTGSAWFFGHWTRSDGTSYWGEVLLSITDLEIL